MDTASLDDVGRAVMEKLPDNYAFVLLVFSHDAHDSRLGYVSNAARARAVEVLRAYEAAL